MFVLSVSVWVSAFFSVCMLIILCHQPFLYLVGQSVSSQKKKFIPSPPPPLIHLLHRQQALHVTTRQPPPQNLLLWTQTCEKNTCLINNPPKTNSPTAHWANSSYQPQIRLCLCGSLPICTKTPLSDSSIQYTHTHIYFLGGVGVLYVLILIDPYQFQLFSFFYTKRLQSKWSRNEVCRHLPLPPF